jgi:CRP-like cAMP-binding protein
MDNQTTAPLYQVWGVDHIAYGPVELPALVSWIKAERVLEDTWIFDHAGARWCKAADLPELKPLFGKKANTLEHDAPETLPPGCLRRIKVFSGMDDAQLQSFASYMEDRRIKQFTIIVEKGEHGDAMFLILEGEVRAFTIVDGKETILSTLGPGEFFGEISLLDQGPRSATVVTNTDTLLLRISADSFERLLREAPALAALFLNSVSRHVVGRLRALNRRYEDSIHWARMSLGE